VVGVFSGSAFGLKDDEPAQYASALGHSSDSKHERRPPSPFRKMVASVRISVLATLKPGLGVVVLVTWLKSGIAAAAREFGKSQIYPVTM
jgi:hypothetical protein